MLTAPIRITESSHSLRQIAKQLVEKCPDELGDEIALIGSAGWGTADEDSDIDIQFWIKQLPPYEAIINWVKSTGTKLSSPDEDIKKVEEHFHVIGNFQNAWVELTWSTISSFEEKLQSILAGNTTERIIICQAWNISTAMPLRTHGLIELWQRKFANYPDKLRQRLLVESCAFWRFPHHIEMLWTLARRRELLGLDEWLFADLQDGLRILFAVNNLWEPDWKNLYFASKLLTRTPAQLVERVNNIYLSQKPEERVERQFRLLLDILALVPASDDVSIAKKNIETILQSHCT